MRTIYAFVLALSLGISLVSCTKTNEIVLSGQLVKVEKPFSHFSSIEVHDGFKVVFVLADHEKVEVEADANVQPHISVIQQGSKLIFKKAEPGVYFPLKTTIKIIVSAKHLDALSAHGGASISSTDTLMTKSLTLALTGGAFVATNLACSDLNISVHGGSKTSLTGFAEYCWLLSTGGSVFKGFDLNARSFKCDVAGGGSVNVTVHENLAVTASGGSTVIYRGDGIVVNEQLTGGSALIKQ